MFFVVQGSDSNLNHMKQHESPSIYLLRSLCAQLSVSQHHHTPNGIKSAFDDWLYRRLPIDVRCFNVFFKALSNIKSGDFSMAYHQSYYLYLIEEEHLIPDIKTFNLLLKAVRLSVPPRYKFIPFIFSEMNRFNVSLDDCTINEVIAMCARHPHKHNIAAARNWFAFYMQHKHDRNAVMLNEYILKSYLSVFVYANDLQNAGNIKRWIQKRNAWNDKMQQTFNKLTYYNVCNRTKRYVL